MPSILVADHHALMREGLVLILRDLVGGSAQVSSVPTCSELFARLENEGTGMVLLDPHMPGSPGNSVFAELRRRAPNYTLVAVSGRTDQHTVAEALRNGARGFIPKASGSNVLQAALETIWAGGVFVPDFPWQQPPAGAVAINGANENRGDGREAARAGLTRRQAEVLDCIRRGYSNRDIALELGMSEGTVKNHVKALMKVLKVRNRTQAALLVL